MMKLALVSVAALSLMLFVLMIGAEILISL